MRKSQEYRNSALASLKGKWAPSVVCTIFYMFAVAVYLLPSYFMNPHDMRPGVLLVCFVLSLFLGLFVINPLTVGFLNAFNRLHLSGDENLTGNMLKISFGKLFRNVMGMFLMCLFAFLWTLLFIVPGVVKSFAYVLTPYILEDNPEISANQAINLSCRMMKGHKFELFLLMLSFIGWILVGILTLGVGYLWLIPYMYTAMAAFYQDVKADYEQKTNYQL